MNEQPNRVEMPYTDTPMTEEEYLAKVCCDMPGGKKPSRIKAIALLLCGSAVVFGALLLCRSMGIV